MFLNRFSAFNEVLNERNTRMWYIFQISIAGYVAYFWCTMPGNSPANFGHGLFLGAILAWYATMLLSSVINRIRGGRLTQSTRLIRPELLDRRSHEKSDKSILTGQ